MAAGEYVSVSSQADTEEADLAMERHELQSKPVAERNELAEIYVSRGLTPELALQVADQLTARDALGAHARDELGMHDLTRARPIQAALASAAAFTAGAIPPALLAGLLPTPYLTVGVTAVTLGLLIVLGSVAAHLGGASRMRGALRRVLGRGRHGMHGGGRPVLRCGRLVLLAGPRRPSCDFAPP